MAEIPYIKDLYENEGLSLNDIVRQIRKNFRTVRKYAHKDDWNQEKQSYSKPDPPSVLGDFIPIVDGGTEQDELEPRKLRHTVKRIYKVGRRIRRGLKTERDFEGSYE